jgi:hypothetical protein
VLEEKVENREIERARVSRVELRRVFCSSLFVLFL